MVRPVRTLFGLCLALASFAPPATAGIAVSTFEDLGVGANSYLNAANPAPPNTPIPYESSGYFVSGGNSFYNVAGEDDYFPYWSGWAISSTTNVKDNVFENQYSAIAGKGADGSATYAVADTGRSPTSINLAPGAKPISFDVTNTTYAALTMEGGDPYGYTQPFSHDLKSFFLLTITGYSGYDRTGLQLGTLEIYLADFRDNDKSKNFILKDWETVLLPSSFENAASLSFSLSSSDNSIWGMNTPSYFALDNLTVALPNVAPVPEPASLSLCLVGIGLGGLLVRLRRKQGI